MTSTPWWDDLVVVKPRYSAFVGTELAGLLRAGGIRTVVPRGPDDGHMR